MNQLLEQPTLADFPPATADLDEEAILRRLELGDRNLEYDDGIFLEKDVSVKSGEVGLLIGHLFLTEALKTRQVRVFGPDVIYRCWPDEPRRFRKPDVTVVRADRMRELGSNPRTMLIPPDLAVEVISPTNTVDDLKREARPLPRRRLRAGVGRAPADQNRRRPQPRRLGDAAARRRRDHRRGHSAGLPPPGRRPLRPAGDGVSGTFTASGGRTCACRLAARPAT